MYRPWRPDEGWDEMELDLDEEFAISRFRSESGCMDPAYGLEEPTWDRDRPDWIDHCSDID